MFSAAGWLVEKVVGKESVPESLRGCGDDCHDFDGMSLKEWYAQQELEKRQLANESTQPAGSNGEKTSPPAYVALDMEGQTMQRKSTAAHGGGGSACGGAGETAQACAGRT